MLFDDENAVRSDYSDFSDSESAKNKDSNNKTIKSIYSDKIAKNLVNSLDRVDTRMLKLHRIVKKPHQKTDLINYLGLKESLFSKSLFKSVPKLSTPDSVTKDSLSIVSTKI